MNMKISILRICISVIIPAVFASCAKDKGDYDAAFNRQPFNGTVYEYLKSQTGVFDSLLLVIDRLGLESEINKDSVTLFAPTNESFKLAVEKYNSGRRQSGSPLTSLSVYDKGFLDTMTRRYIIPGMYRSIDLFSTEGKPLKAFSGYPMNGRMTYSNAQGNTGGGATIITFSDTKYSQFKTEWLNTTANAVDITTSNGVVHVLDAGHVFGFDNFTKERKPFRGVPFEFPVNLNAYKIMEAEDYDRGGDGVAFRSPTGRNTVNDALGLAHRRDGFPLYSHSAGTTGGIPFPLTLDLRDMASGHWVTYSIDVPEEGDYKVQTRYRINSSSPTTLMQYHIDFDLVNLTGSITHGKDAYPAWSFSDVTVHLTGGPHIMRFFFEIPSFIHLDAFVITRLN